MSSAHNKSSKQKMIMFRLGGCEVLKSRQMSSQFLNLLSVNGWFIVAGRAGKEKAYILQLGV